MTSPTESGSLESSTIARKRKGSTDDNAIGRAIKHRSSQACQSCRMRKVRCDVIANGSRCTNCRLDRTECVVTASRRGRHNHAHRNNSTNITQTLSPVSARAVSESGPDVTRNDSWKGHEAMSNYVVSNGAADVPVCVTFDEDLDNLGSEHQPAADDGNSNGTDHASSEAYNGHITLETAPDKLKQFQSSVGKAPLPAFITPLSGRIMCEDLDFLTQKGALILPEPELRVEILRGYLFSVQPFMPMLDFRAFIRAVLDNGQDGQISLLLFQAVMFAGLHSLQLQIIHRLGFESTKQAREVFFNRVRLLYEFDVEPDSAAVLQSLVLMSSWYGKWDERRHTWHWTGLAYDFARCMGLHREPIRVYGSDKLRRFRRRLWWSLYIRDRMIALGTRRPMRIRDDEFDVEMLTLEDFDVESLEELGQGRPLVSSANENTSIALMCIQLAKLCICIGRVVSSQYTTLSTQPDVPHTVMVVSRRDEGRIEELESCEKELDDWFQALGTNVRTDGSPSAQDGPNSCSEVHWAMLNMTYLIVVNVLHRAQALQPLPDAAEAQIVQRSSRSKVKDAARSLTRILQNMLRNDQVRFLGTSGVTALVAACLSHMLDISSGDEDVRDASTLRLYQSLQILQSLRGIYASADAAVSFLASVTQRAGIHIPAPVAAPAADFVSASADSFAQPSIIRPKSTVWSDPTGSLGRKEGFSSEQNPPKTLWQVNPFQVLTQSADRHPQPQPQPLQDKNRQFPTNSSAMQTNARMGTVGAAAVAYATPNTALMSRHEPTDLTRDTPTMKHSHPNSVDSTLGGLSNSAVDGAFFDWNLGMDAGSLETMSFNHDYYLDAHWFQDGHL